MHADITVHPVEELARRFARLAEDTAREAIATHGSFALAIPGGSAAEKLLPSLIDAGIDWGRGSVDWVDERMVLSDDPAANIRLARTVWLNHASVAPDRVHPMPGGATDTARAVATYARQLRERLGEPTRFDLVLLGVGEDGHVASLFPGHRLLRTWDRDVAILEDAPKPPPSRMTLTLRALTAARRIVVFAAGAGKAGAIRDVVENEDSELPLALATMGGGPVTFLLDPEAASQLSR